MVYLSEKQHSIDGDAQLAREQALDVINLLRRPVSSVLDLEEDGSVKPRRVAPSLLASFADMFAQDLVFGQPTLRCVCCGMPFVSRSYQAKYCSRDVPVAGAEAASARPDQECQGSSCSGPKRSADRRCAPSAAYDSERLAERQEAKEDQTPAYLIGLTAAVTKVAGKQSCRT